MKLQSQPGWGAGLVIRDLPLHWELFFEHGGERKFVKSMATSLVPVTLSPADLAALQAKAFGPETKPDVRPKSRVRTRVVSGASKRRFASFEEQLSLFGKLFPGGFGGKTFLKEERGIPGVTEKSGDKEALIALAQSELSRERFETAAPEALFESAKKVLQGTTIVFPMEGLIPFSTLDVQSLAPAIEALKHLLHGEGDYGDRVQDFAIALDLKDKNGDAKAATWPLATIFGAFFDPDQFICVKPTVFTSQGAILGLSVEKSQPVTADGYREFSDVAARTRALLQEAGQQPRDLLDVYSFIWRTHHEKPS